MINDNTIIDLINMDGKIHILKIITKSFLKRNPEIQQYLINRFKDSQSIQETLYRIYYKIEIRPTYPYCGNPLRFIGGKDIFTKYCSISCASFHTSPKAKETCRKLYGSGTNVKKYKETCLKRYGVDNAAKLDSTREKFKKTCQEKYGTDTPLKNPEVIEKSKKTCKERYGVEYIMQSKEIQEKIQETFREKYGVNYPLENKEIHQKTIDNPERKEHVYQTKKRNKTFNSSKIEEQIYQWLIEEFSNEDVIRQYKEERYPWNSDFYIKSLDLFIEINGHWTHGLHPFDENNPEDLAILEKWKEKSKNSQFFINAINTWTVRDVQKRNKAKENNLKRLEFFEAKFLSKEELLQSIKLAGM